MGEVGDLLKLSEAMRIWTGWGTLASPDRNDDRVVRHFGEAAASKLLPSLKALESDFYASTARLTATDLQDMAARASQDFRNTHQGIPEDIVAALSWCYTFDFK